MTRTRSRWLAWGLCGMTVAVAVAFVVVAIIDPNVGGPENASPSGPSPQDKASGGYVPYAVFSGIIFAAFAVVGGVVAARRPRNPIGWFLSVGALLWSLGVLSSSVYWHMAFGRSDPPAAADYVAWLGSWTFLPAFVLLLSLVPLLFPTGAPPGPRWRVVGWAAAVAGGVATLSTALAPGPMDSADFAWVDNPFGVQGLGLRTIAAVSFIAVAVAALSGVISVVVRYRRARGIERLQLRWLAVAVCVLVVGAVGGSAATPWLGEGAGWIGILLGLLGVVVAIAIALLRYRLYDIDVVVNRTLVYGALTATLALAYLGGVLLLELALRPLTESSNLAIAGSTLGGCGALPAGAWPHPGHGRSPVLPAEVRHRADTRTVWHAAARRGRPGRARQRAARSGSGHHAALPRVAVAACAGGAAMSERVEPEWAMVTVMFVDIRGFTTFADHSTAREAVAYLNEFFGVVVPVLTAHGGHPNKLLGDGLLGVFGAPDRCDDHADRALAAAEDMLASVGVALRRALSHRDRDQLGAGARRDHRWGRPHGVRRDRRSRERRCAGAGRDPRARRAAAADRGHAAPARPHPREAGGARNPVLEGQVQAGHGARLAIP